MLKLIHSSLSTCIPSGLPSPPQSPNISTIQYASQNITVVIQWGYPQYDGGSPVDNYTVILVGPGAVQLSTTITASVHAMTTLLLDYNKEYSVNIAATNCVGTGGIVSLNILKGICIIPYCPGQAPTGACISSNIKKYVEWTVACFNV